MRHDLVQGVDRHRVVLGACLVAVQTGYFQDEVQDVGLWCLLSTGTGYCPAGVQLVLALVSALASPQMVWRHLA